MRMPTITWGELTELIKAVASLAWPIVAFILMLMFDALRDDVSLRVPRTDSS